VDHLLQGWHADPFGVHEQRYFSGGRPTRLVRDGRVEAHDEPPATHEGPDGVAVAATVRPAAGHAAGAGLWASSGPTAPGGSGGPPATSDRDAAAAGYPPAPSASAPARKRRVGLVNTMVTLAAAAALVTFVAIEAWQHGPTSHPGPGSTGTELAAFVSASARATVAQQTADVSLTAISDINGTLVNLRGEGQIDLSSNSFAFELKASYAGTTLAENEIVTSHALYIQLAMNGQSLVQLLGGKHWMEIPLAAPATVTSSLQDSPARVLQLLEEQGAQVRAIGSRTVGGLTCSGYEATPSRQAMVAATQQDVAQLGLSAPERAAALQAASDSTPPTITVWLDPTRQLACELAVSMQVATVTSDGPGTRSLQMLLTFTHYGVPVDITAPAPSDTLTVGSTGTIPFEPHGQS